MMIGNLQIEMTPEAIRATRYGRDGVEAEKQLSTSLWVQSTGTPGAYWGWISGVSRGKVVVHRVAGQGIAHNDGAPSYMQFSVYLFNSIPRGGGEATQLYFPLGNDSAEALVLQNLAIGYSSAPPTNYMNLRHGGIIATQRFLVQPNGAATDARYEDVVFDFRAAGERRGVVLNGVNEHIVFTATVVTGPIWGFVLDCSLIPED